MEFFVLVFIAIVAAAVKKLSDQRSGSAGGRNPGWPKPAAWARPQQPPPGWQPPPMAPNPAAHPPQGPSHVAPYVAPHVATGLPQHRPPQHQLPTPQGDLDAQARALMAANNEVAAVRLLCDETDLGIIEAQKYARSLVAPATGAGPKPGRPAGTPVGPVAVEAEETRYVGSAAFATSTFDSADDEEWASGWTDTPAPDDRSDIDELWQTVRDAQQPAARGDSGGEQPADGA